MILYPAVALYAGITEFCIASLTLFNILFLTSSYTYWCEHVWTMVIYDKCLTIKVKKWLWEKQLYATASNHKYMVKKGNFF